MTLYLCGYTHAGMLHAHAPQVSYSAAYEQPDTDETSIELTEWDVDTDGARVSFEIGEGIAVCLGLGGVEYEWADSCLGDRVIGRYPAIVGFTVVTAEVYVDGTLCLWAHPDADELEELIALARGRVDEAIEEQIEERADEQAADDAMDQAGGWR